MHIANVSKKTKKRKNTDCYNINGKSKMLDAFLQYTKLNILGTHMFIFYQRFIQREKAFLSPHFMSNIYGLHI